MKSAALPLDGGENDRVGAIRRRYAGRDAVARVDRVRVRRAVARLVARGQDVEAELVATLLGEAEADEPAAVRRHEVDGVRRRVLGRDREVALVLAVGIVDDDDEATLPNLVDRLLGGHERRGTALRKR